MQTVCSPSVSVFKGTTSTRRASVTSTGVTISRPTARVVFSAQQQSQSEKVKAAAVALPILAGPPNLVLGWRWKTRRLLPGLLAPRIGPLATLAAVESDQRSSGWVTVGPASDRARSGDGTSEKWDDDVVNRMPVKPPQDPGPPGPGGPATPVPRPPISPGQATDSRTFKSPRDLDANYVRGPWRLGIGGTGDFSFAGFLQNYGVASSNFVMVCTLSGSAMPAAFVFTASGRRGGRNVWPFKTSDDNGGPFDSSGFHLGLREAWPNILASEANGTLAVKCSLHAATSAVDVLKIVGEVASIVGAVIVAAVIGGNAASECKWQGPDIAPSTPGDGGVDVVWRCNK